MSTQDRRGFTLIELLVVLAIIGGILAIVSPRLLDKKSKMKEAVRELAGLVREVHNAARLHNQTFRLVIKMSEKGHSYSLEAAPGNVTLMTEEQAEDEEKSSTFDSREKSKKKNQFSEDSRFLKKPRELPRGFYFGEIEYGNRSEAVGDGTAYIHFFPQGLVEEAVIHLTDRRKLNWTIALHPITGRANLYEGKVPLKELREK